MRTRRAGLTLLILPCVALVPNAESPAARPGNRVRLVKSTTKPSLVVGQLVRLGE